MTFDVKRGKSNIKIVSIRVLRKISIIFKIDVLRERKNKNVNAHSYFQWMVVKKGFLIYFYI